MTENKLKNSKITSDYEGIKLYVKYMVCLRDKMILRSELEKLGLDYEISFHGAIKFHEEVTETQHISLKKGLLRSGLVLLNETESSQIDKVINIVIEVIHFSDVIPKKSLIDIISERFDTGEESIHKMFSDVKGCSIQQFILANKIERIKELLLYDNLNLTNIAEKLNFKTRKNMSAQFAKITGLTPSYFKKLRNERLKFSKHSKTPILIKTLDPKESDPFRLKQTPIIKILSVPISTSS
jgi:AraC-like DNA-binding protein